MKRFYVFRFLTFVFLLTLFGAGAYAQVPTISSFSPASGPIGTSVTLTGSNFNTTATNNIVFFGSTMATVTSASATSLTITVPAGASYQRVSVTDITTSLTGYSASPFGVTYSKGTVTYASHVDVLAGSAPWNVAVGDLDGDGKPDVVVTNATSGTISIYRNQSAANVIGISSFVPKVDITTATMPQGVVIADIDGDGKQDIIVSNAGSASVSVFRNIYTSGTLAATSFATRLDFTTGTTPYTVAVGDIDGDGKPDLVTANSGSTTVSVLRNTSTSTGINFATKVDLTTGSVPRGVALADFDGDGKLDIAVSNNGAATVSVFKNSATAGNIIAANFAARVNFTVGSSPNWIAIGDLDGDGKPDIAVSNYASSSVSLLLNTTASGTINFATKVDLTTASTSRFLALADLDGDGKIDVVAANDVSGSVSIFKNKSTTGALSFNTKTDYNTLGTPEGIALGDLNGDGQTDITVADNNGSAFSVLRNVLNNSSLSALSISGGSLNPTFVAATNAYTSTVTNASITVTPALSDANATVKVNGTAVTNGTASGSIALALGSNTITVLVTAQDATTTTYTLTVTRVSAYYSKATGDLSALATYGTATDGTGTPPSDFNGSGTNAAYQLANRTTYTLTSALTIGSALGLPTSGTLDLAGNTLTVNTIIGAGTLTGSNTSSLVVNGTVTGLSFATGQEKLNNLTLNASSSLTMSSFLAISGTGTVTLGSGSTLNTNNTLTLRSDATGTGQIAALGTGATISGNITVERYIADKRAWRLISPSVNSSQTINTAWQEGAGGTMNNPNPGYGTFIVGSNTTNGFDIASTSGSLLAYNGTAFNSVPNTSTVLNTNTAYFLFAIGSRGVNPATAGVHGATTLRSSGSVLTGTQVTPVTAAGYTLVGNPYPAPADFANVTKSTTVADRFYAWDINLGTYGGYVLITNSGGTYTSVPTSPSGLTNIIPSGAAIFVNSNGTTAGTLTFNESSKAIAAGAGSFSNFNTSVAVATHDIRVNLTDNNSNLVDGVMASYAAGNSNNVDNSDAPKLPNFYENISLARSGKLLMMEKRSDITAKDTIFIQLSGVKATTYNLQINPNDFNAPSGMTANLEDAYLKTSTKLDLTQISNISFTTATADSTSYKNRFQITFAAASPTTAAVTKISHVGAAVVAYPNPAVQKQINLSFDGLPAGNYNITVMNTFGQVMQKSNMVYNGTTTNKLLATDYSTGVYTVNIQTAGYNQSIKVIVP